MATRLTKVIADFQTTLAVTMSVGATSGTLATAIDDDQVALPAGNYFFTIDGDNSQKEHIVCALNGTTLTSIKTVSRQGVQSTGTLRLHRAGAQVIMTDWAVLNELTNLLNGTTGLDATTPLEYDDDPSITDDKHIATKKYTDDVATAGALKASATVIGISKLSHAPVDADVPIAVGDNDPRIPTTGEKAALAGTGTPSSANKYVTETDPNIAGSVKLTGDQEIGGVKTFTSNPILPASNPTTDNQAVRKKYVDDNIAFTNTTEITGETGGWNAPDTNNVLISYQKVGKYYFNFQAVVTSGNRSPILRDDSTSRARLCTKLGITESTYGSTYKLRVVSGPIALQYNGTKWAPWDTPGADTTVVTWIKST